MVDWRPLDVFSDSEPLKEPSGSSAACTHELAPAEHGAKGGEEEGERGEDESKRTRGGGEMGERCDRRGGQRGEKSEKEGQGNSKAHRESGKQGASREREEERTAKYERGVQKGDSQTIQKIVKERERQTSEKEQKCKNCERGGKEGETGTEKDYEMLEGRTADGDKAEGKAESEGTGWEREDESEPHSKSVKEEEHKKGRKRDKGNREQGGERPKTDDEQLGSASDPEEEEYGQEAEAKMEDRTKERRSEQEEDNRDSNARKRQKQSRKGQHSGGVSGEEGKVKTPFLSAFSNCRLTLVTANYSSKENEKQLSGVCGGTYLDPCLLTPTGRGDERSEEIKKRTDIVAVSSVALSSAGERTEEKRPLTGEAEEEETQTNERDEGTFITTACAGGAAEREPSARTGKRRSLNRGGDCDMFSSPDNMQIKQDASPKDIGVVEMPQSRKKADVDTVVHRIEEVIDRKRSTNGNKPCARFSTASKQAVPLSSKQDPVGSPLGKTEKTKEWMTNPGEHLPSICMDERRSDVLPEDALEGACSHAVENESNVNRIHEESDCPGVSEEGCCGLGADTRRVSGSLSETPQGPQDNNGVARKTLPSSICEADVLRRPPDRAWPGNSAGEHIGEHERVFLSHSTNASLVLRGSSLLSQRDLPTAARVDGSTRKHKETRFDEEKDAGAFLHSTIDNPVPVGTTPKVDRSLETVEGETWSSCPGAGSCSVPISEAKLFLSTSWKREISPALQRCTVQRTVSALSCPSETTRPFHVNDSNASGKTERGKTQDTWEARLLGKADKGFDQRQAENEREDTVCETATQTGTGCSVSTNEAVNEGRGSTETGTRLEIAPLQPIPEIPSCTASSSPSASWHEVRDTISLPSSHAFAFLPTRPVHSIPSSEFAPSSPASSFLVQALAIHLVSLHPCAACFMDLFPLGRSIQEMAVHCRVQRQHLRQPSVAAHVLSYLLAPPVLAKSVRESEASRPGQTTSGNACVRRKEAGREFENASAATSSGVCAFPAWAPSTSFGKTLMSAYTSGIAPHRQLSECASTESFQTVSEREAHAAAAFGSAPWLLESERERLGSRERSHTSLAFLDSLPCPVRMIGAAVAEEKGAEGIQCRGGANRATGSRLQRANAPLAERNESFLRATERYFSLPESTAPAAAVPNHERAERQEQKIARKSDVVTVGWRDSEVSSLSGRVFSSDCIDAIAGSQDSTEPLSLSSTSTFSQRNTVGGVGSGGLSTLAEPRAQFSRFLAFPGPQWASDQEAVRRGKAVTMKSRQAKQGFPFLGVEEGRGMFLPFRDNESEDEDGATHEQEEHSRRREHARVRGIIRILFRVLEASERDNADLLRRLTERKRQEGEAPNNEQAQLQRREPVTRNPTHNDESGPERQRRRRRTRKLEGARDRPTTCVSSGEGDNGHGPRRRLWSRQHSQDSQMPLAHVSRPVHMSSSPQLFHAYSGVKLPSLEMVSESISSGSQSVSGSEANDGRTGGKQLRPPPAESDSPSSGITPDSSLYSSLSPSRAYSAVEDVREGVTEAVTPYGLQMTLETGTPRESVANTSKHLAASARESTATSAHRDATSGEQAAAAPFPIWSDRRRIGRSWRAGRVQTSQRGRGKGRAKRRGRARLSSSWTTRLATGSEPLPCRETGPITRQTEQRRCRTASETNAESGEAAQVCPVSPARGLVFSEEDEDGETRETEREGASQEVVTNGKTGGAKKVGEEATETCIEEDKEVSPEDNLTLEEAAGEPVANTATTGSGRRSEKKGEVKRERAGKTSRGKKPTPFRADEELRSSGKALWVRQRCQLDPSESERQGDRRTQELKEREDGKRQCESRTGKAQTAPGAQRKSPAKENRRRTLREESFREREEEMQKARDHQHLLRLLTAEAKTLRPWKEGITWSKTQGRWVVTAPARSRIPARVFTPHTVDEVAATLAGACEYLDHSRRLLIRPNLSRSSESKKKEKRLRAQASDAPKAPEGSDADLPAGEKVSLKETKYERASLKEADSERVSLKETESEIVPLNEPEPEKRGRKREEQMQSADEPARPSACLNGRKYDVSCSSHVGEDGEKRCRRFFLMRRILSDHGNGSEEITEVSPHASETTGHHGVAMKIADDSSVSSARPGGQPERRREVDTGKTAEANGGKVDADKREAKMVPDSTANNSTFTSAELDKIAENMRPLRYPMTYWLKGQRAFTVKIFTFDKVAIDASCPSSRQSLPPSSGAGAGRMPSCNEEEDKPGARCVAHDEGKRGDMKDRDAKEAAQDDGERDEMKSSEAKVEEEMRDDMKEREARGAQARRRAQGRGEEQEGERNPKAPSEGREEATEETNAERRASRYPATPIPYPSPLCILRNKKYTGCRRFALKENTLRCFYESYEEACLYAASLGYPLTSSVARAVPGFVPLLSSESAVQSDSPRATENTVLALTTSLERKSPNKTASRTQDTRNPTGSLLTPAGRGYSRMKNQGDKTASENRATAEVKVSAMGTDEGVEKGGKRVAREERVETELKHEEYSVGSSIHNIEQKNGDASEARPDECCRGAVLSENRKLKAKGTIVDEDEEEDALLIDCFARRKATRRKSEGLSNRRITHRSTNAHGTCQTSTPDERAKTHKVSRAQSSSAETSRMHQNKTGPEETRLETRLEEVAAGHPIISIAIQNETPASEGQIAADRRHDTMQKGSVNHGKQGNASATRESRRETKIAAENDAIVTGLCIPATVAGISLLTEDTRTGKNIDGNFRAGNTGDTLTEIVTGNSKAKRREADQHASEEDDMKEEAIGKNTAAKRDRWCHSEDELEVRSLRKQASHSERQEKEEPTAENTVKSERSVEPMNSPAASTLLFRNETEQAEVGARQTTASGFSNNDSAGPETGKSIEVGMRQQRGKLTRAQRYQTGVEASVASFGGEMEIEKVTSPETVIADSDRAAIRSVEDRYVSRMCDGSEGDMNTEWRGSSLRRKTLLSTEKGWNAFVSNEDNDVTQEDDTGQGSLPTTLLPSHLLFDPPQISVPSPAGNRASRLSSTGETVTLKVDRASPVVTEKHPPEPEPNASPSSLIRDAFSADSCVRKTEHDRDNTTCGGPDMQRHGKHTIQPSFESSPIVSPPEKCYGRGEQERSERGLANTMPIENVHASDDTSRNRTFGREAENCQKPRQTSGARQEMVTDKGVATTENALPEGHKKLKEISASNDETNFPCFGGDPEARTSGEQQRQRYTRETETENTADMKKTSEDPFCTSSANGKPVSALAYYCVSGITSMPLPRHKDTSFLSLLQICGETKPETPKKSVTLGRWLKDHRNQMPRSPTSSRFYTSVACRQRLRAYTQPGTSIITVPTARLIPVSREPKLKTEGAHTSKQEESGARTEIGIKTSIHAECNSAGANGQNEAYGESGHGWQRSPDRVPTVLRDCAPGIEGNNTHCGVQSPEGTRKAEGNYHHRERRHPKGRGNRPARISPDDGVRVSIRSRSLRKQRSLNFRCRHRSPSHGMMSSSMRRTETQRWKRQWKPGSDSTPCSDDTRQRTRKFFFVEDNPPVEWWNKRLPSGFSHHLTRITTPSRQHHKEDGCYSEEQTGPRREENGTSPVSRSYSRTSREAPASPFLDERRFVAYERNNGRKTSYEHAITRRCYQSPDSKNTPSGYSTHNRDCGNISVQVNVCKVQNKALSILDIYRQSQGVTSDRGKGQAIAPDRRSGKHKSDRTAKPLYHLDSRVSKEREQNSCYETDDEASGEDADPGGNFSCARPSSTKNAASVSRQNSSKSPTTQRLTQKCRRRRALRWKDKETITGEGHNSRDIPRNSVRSHGEAHQSAAPRRRTKDREANDIPRYERDYRIHEEIYSSTECNSSREDKQKRECNGRRGLDNENPLCSERRTCWLPAPASRDQRDSFFGARRVSKARNSTFARSSPCTSYWRDMAACVTKCDDTREVSQRRATTRDQPATPPNRPDDELETCTLYSQSARNPTDLWTSEMRSRTSSSVSAKRPNTLSNRLLDAFQIEATSFAHALRARAVAKQRIKVSLLTRQHTDPAQDRDAAK
ncbi:UNVERIFIED_CONTAM: hypothetical protein HHA_245440 [Hammondia hammondi]|eukprot:XP_008883645.1 hypothetical protein HHA_245440 [Hammondia hammondi]